jgi:nucleotide-binding universal stress UspA family protein
MTFRSEPDAEWRTTVTPRRIAVPLDRSALAERALAPAAEIAARTGATLHLVHVRQSALPADGATTAAGDLANARDYLAAVAARLTAWAHVEVECATLRGRVAPAICAEAAAAGADLIVMSTHGRTGWRRLWIGSVADAVLHRTRIPVLLVRASGAAAVFAPRHVLVPVDGTPDCDRVLRSVAGILGPFTPRVELLEVVAPMLLTSRVAPLGAAVVESDDGATEATVQLARRYLARSADRLAGFRPEMEVVTTAVVDEPATHAIVQAASRADVVAIASHGRGASRLLVGSVCDKLLGASAATLLVVPSARGGVDEGAIPDSEAVPAPR